MPSFLRTNLQGLLTPTMLGGSDPLVICGFGQLGQGVMRTLIRMRSLDICVVDHRATNAAQARKQGLRSVCGNAEGMNVLRVARVGSATDIVICIDGSQNERILQSARSLAPTACIQMVVSNSLEPEKLCELGADRVHVISDIAGTALAQWAVRL